MNKQEILQTMQALIERRNRLNKSVDALIEELRELENEAKIRQGKGIYLHQGKEYNYLTLKKCNDKRR